MCWKFPVRKVVLFPTICENFTFVHSEYADACICELHVLNTEVIWIYTMLILQPSVSIHLIQKVTLLRTRASNSARITESILAQNLVTYKLSPSLCLWGPTKSCASRETQTGKLCIECHSSVSILVTAVIAAIIGHSELWITQPSHECFRDPRMNRWIVIWQMFVAEYLPQFRGNWKWLSLQSVRVHSHD